LNILKISPDKNKCDHLTCPISLVTLWYWWIP